MVMRLSKYSLVEMNRESDMYIYIYALLGLGIFRAKFLKFVFTSPRPHYWWSEISKAMTQNGIYFEDLTEHNPIDIGIGSICYSYFTQEDKDKYGDEYNWKILLDDALDVQRAFEEEYNANRGLLNQH